MHARVYGTNRVPYISTSELVLIASKRAPFTGSISAEFILFVCLSADQLCSFCLSANRLGSFCLSALRLFAPVKPLKNSAGRPMGVRNKPQNI